MGRVAANGGTLNKIQGLIDLRVARIDAKDTVGGIIECTVDCLPIGLGEPFFNSVESLLAHALFAIPAVKGVEFGAGFTSATMFGSQHNDALMDDTGKTKTAQLAASML